MFLKRGDDCLVAIAVLALLAVAAGGYAHIDLGGAICAFMVGGLVGLAVLATYNKGRRDAEQPTSGYERSER